MPKKMNKKEAKDKKNTTKSSKSKSQKKGDKRKKDDDDRQDPLNKVRKYCYFAKFSIAPYPDEHGCPFYLNDNDDENTFA